MPGLQPLQACDARLLSLNGAAAAAAGVLTCRRPLPADWHGHLLTRSSAASAGGLPRHCLPCGVTTLATASGAFQADGR